MVVTRKLADVLCVSGLKPASILRSLTPGGATKDQDSRGAEAELISPG